MTAYGQFCSIARTLELLGGRWTLLIVRELLCGSRRFGEIRLGVPRISKTVLSERLQTLVLAGAIESTEGSHGPEYVLTESGRELAAILEALGVWGQAWLPRHIEREDLDLMPLLVDMRRRIRNRALPEQPLVVRFQMRGQRTPHYLLLRREEVSLCVQNPGFPEPLRVGGSLAALTGWWRGDFEFADAKRRGLSIEGARDMVRSFPGWFERYQFADIRPSPLTATLPAPA